MKKYHLCFSSGSAFRLLLSGGPAKVVLCNLPGVRVSIPCFLGHLAVICLLAQGTCYCVSDCGVIGVKRDGWIRAVANEAAAVNGSGFVWGSWDDMTDGPRWGHGENPKTCIADLIYSAQVKWPSIQVLFSLSSSHLTCGISVVGKPVTEVHAREMAQLCKRCNEEACQVYPSIRSQLLLSGIDYIMTRPTVTISRPLLVCIRGVYPHEEVFVVDPHKEPAARRMVSMPVNIRFLHPLDRSRIIAYRYSFSREARREYFLVDLEEAKCSPLLAGAVFGCELVAIQGRRAFFLEHREERTGTMRECEAGVDLRKVRRRTDWLRVVDLDGDLTPELFFEHVITSFFRGEGGRFWVGVDDPRPALWMVSAERGVHGRVLESLAFLLGVDGRELWAVTESEGSDAALWLVDQETMGTRLLVTLDRRWELAPLSASLSPDGRRLALGVAEKGGSPGKRRLVVVDLGAGMRVFLSPEINVGMFPGERWDAPLMFGWLDDWRIRFSESGFDAQEYAIFRRRTEDAPFPVPGEPVSYLQWVDVDIVSGERVLVEIYGSRALMGHVSAHRLPDGSRTVYRVYRWGRNGALVFTDGSWRCETKEKAVVSESPFFRMERGRLYWADGELIVNVLDRSGALSGGYVGISPDGKWAVYHVGDGVWLVSGERRSKERVIDGWCYGFEWCEVGDSE